MFLSRCSQTTKCQQEDLAKFGYRPDMNVEFLKNPCMFCLPPEPLVEISVLKLFFSKHGKLGPSFSQNILCICQNHVFEVEKMQKVYPKLE
jgi:hypothetical protein